MNSRGSSFNRYPQQHQQHHYHHQQQHHHVPSSSLSPSSSSTSSSSSSATTSATATSAAAMVAVPTSVTTTTAGNGSTGICTPSSVTAIATLSSKTKTLTVSTMNACMSYALASASVTIMNKIVFSHANFHYPWFTLAVQNLISVATISTAHHLGFTRSGVLSHSLARRMPLPIIFFVLFIFTNAQSLRHVSLPILTVWKSLGPMLVTLFERFYFGDRFSTSVYLSMTLIVLSAFVTAINDLEYSAMGYLWAFLNVLSNVAYLASLRIYLRDPNISALDKTFHSNLLSIVPIIPMSLISGEFPAVLNALAARATSFKAAFLLSGFLTTAVCASAFWTISLTNGSTLSFIGGFNKVPIILLSLVLFDMRISTEGWIGVSLGVVAGILFASAKSMQLGGKRRGALTNNNSNSIHGSSKSHAAGVGHGPTSSMGPNSTTGVSVGMLSTGGSNSSSGTTRANSAKRLDDTGRLELSDDTGSNKADDLKPLNTVLVDVHDKQFGPQDVSIGERPRSRSLSPPQITR